MITVAALYVMPGGCYYGLPDVDPWPESRDARLYAGPHPVVAHPPCARWSRLAGLVESRYPHCKQGDDGGCFAAALAAVRLWGGVLEHPAESAAWRAYDLPPPTQGAWVRGLCGGWSTQVAQSSYGHRARKLTWLYYYGTAPPPSLDWRVRPHTARVSYCANRGAPPPGVEQMHRRERLATPLAFRDLLLSIARGARQ